MLAGEKLPTPRGSGRMLQLDGLRALAIFGVMLHHFGVKPTWWLDWGPVAPTVFFLLSGYLITLSLLKMRERGTANAEGLLGYHLRRFARLVPALYLLLGIGALIGLAGYRENFWWHGLFLSNVLMGITGEWAGSLSHLWSLAKQEQFYLLWPLLLFVPIRWLGVAIALVGISAVVFRAWCILAGVDPMFRWMMLPGSLDAFAVGGLIALAMRKKKEWIPPGWAWPSVFLALALWYASRALRKLDGSGTVLTAFVEVFEVACFGLVIVGLIQFPQSPLSRFLASKPMALLGKISYGLFIWHIMVVLALGPYLDSVGLTIKEAVLPRAAILTLGSIGLAILSWIAIEKPSIAWSKAIEASGVATTTVGWCRRFFGWIRTGCLTIYGTIRSLLLSVFRPRA